MKRPAATMMAAVLLTGCLAQTPRNENPTVAISTPGSHPQTAGDTSAARKPLLGQTLAEAQRTEFFTFFNLAKTGNQPDVARDGFAFHLFGTKGAFKGNINLIVATRANSDVIATATLMLQRDFIDSPATTRFARDAAKTFVELSPGISTAALQALHERIWTGCSSGLTEYTLDQTGYAKKPCPPATAESPAYLVFLGKQEKLRIAHPGGYLMLQNTNKGWGVPVLLVEIGKE